MDSNSLPERRRPRPFSFLSGGDVSDVSREVRRFLPFLEAFEQDIQLLDDLLVECQTSVQRQPIIFERMTCVIETAKRVLLEVQHAVGNKDRPSHRLRESINFIKGRPASRGSTESLDLESQRALVDWHHAAILAEIYRVRQVSSLANNPDNMPLEENRWARHPPTIFDNVGPMPEMMGNTPMPKQSNHGIAELSTDHELSPAMRPYDRAVTITPVPVELPADSSFFKPDVMAKEISAHKLDADDGTKRSITPAIVPTEQVDFSGTEQNAKTGITYPYSPDSYWNTTKRNATPTQAGLCDSEDKRRGVEGLQEGLIIRRRPIAKGLTSATGPQSQRITQTSYVKEEDAVGLWLLFGYAGD